MIIVKSMPFDSKLVEGEYDRAINSKDFARYLSSFISNGVIISDGGILGTELQVENAGGMKVIVNPGAVHINGRIGWLDTGLETLLLDIGGSLDRIDRVVVEMNATEDIRSIIIKVIKGVENANPVPPNLIRAEDIYQISLAQCRVNAGQSVITSILDERADTNLCGIARAKIRNWGDLKGLN
ncbi:MAG: hypothetical protein GX896_06890 [Clostridiales bacterium]|nr:hypothetical protein [Clostridiales bacterium]